MPGSTVIPAAKSDLLLQGSTASPSVATCLGTGPSDSTPTIVNGGAGALQDGFLVKADNITIQNFTVQNASGDSAGVNLSAATSGNLIRNNIIQNNTFGLHLNNRLASTATEPEAPHRGAHHVASDPGRHVGLGRPSPLGEREAGRGARDRTSARASLRDPASWPCGTLGNRREVLDLLTRLPSASIATHAEARGFLERRSLMGRGIGFIDVHLLASAALTNQARLWTRDRRLAVIATELHLAYA